MKSGERQMPSDKWRGPTEAFGISRFTFHVSRFTHQRTPVTRHVSLVTRHLSPVTCHPSPVTCHPSAVPFTLMDAMIVAAFAFRTNRLSEGVDGPNDLGDLGYQDYSYTMECHEHETFTNGLVEVNFVLLHKGNPVDNLTVWRFDPNFHSSMSHGGIGR